MFCSALQVKASPLNVAISTARKSVRKFQLTEQIGLDMELRVCGPPLLHFERALPASQIHHGGFGSVVLRPATSQKVFLSGSNAYLEVILQICLHKGKNAGTQQI